MRSALKYTIFRPKDMFPLDIVICLLAFGFEYDDWRRGCLACNEIIFIFEEAQQLTTQY